ncbi:MAG: AsnC family transcriptional regulator [Thermoplasmata archaeon]|nr:AsnC family transcriptional regulator [Thermoplasmata archaeon]
MELDRTDVEILRALQGDGRLSFRALARRTGVSVPTVSARVAKLEGMGILSGYHATVDPVRLGQVRVVLILKTRRSRAKGVSAGLAALPEVRWAFVDRESRIVAEAVVSRGTDIERFCKEIESIPGVVACEHFVATNQLKDEPAATLSTRLTAIIPCFECGREIEGEPVRWKKDGRTHYLCCTSCEKLYKERYAKIRAAA